MNEFPRTMVGGVSVSRMIIGTNWFLGYSHTSVAKDKFITSYQTREKLADIATYVQLYNAAGFLMQIEADWVMRIIKNAKKPVMTIKPLAAGRLLPPVGLAFAWNTIRECDMITIGTTTPDEAREVIELSLDFQNKRLPDNTLQKTRSKKSLTGE